MREESRRLSRFPSFSLPILYPRERLPDGDGMAEKMKIAFLCEIPYEKLIVFRQHIEDLVNSSSGKLIYVLKSNNPIRLIESPNLIPSGEVVKNHPAHTLGSSIAGSGVKDAERNGNRRLGFHDHSGGCASRGPCGNVSQRYSASEFVQECNRRECDGGCASHAASHLDRGSRSPCVRLRFLAANPRWTRQKALLNTTLGGFSALHSPSETFFHGA